MADNSSRRSAGDPSQPRRSSDPTFAAGDAATFMISVAAELAGMHAQTLRTYDRLGLVTPQRASGGGRRYSSRDVDLLREIQRLSQDEGVNLAGIKRIIELSREVEALHRQVAELADTLKSAQSRPSGDLVPVQRTSALVVWQPRRGGRRAK